MVERGLGAALAKALDGHMSVDQFERGDIVRVVAQELTVLGEFSRYAGIEAVEVRRKDGQEKPFRLYYHRGKSERGYYDDKGRSPYEGGWRKPVKDAPITSRFNPKRHHRCSRRRCRTRDRLRRAHRRGGGRIVVRHHQLHRRGWPER